MLPVFVDIDTRLSVPLQCRGNSVLDLMSDMLAIVERTADAWIMTTDHRGTTSQITSLFMEGTSLTSKGTTNDRTATSMLTLVRCQAT